MQSQHDHSQYEQSQHEYSEFGFWHKARRYALKAGRNLIETALTLYYVAESPHTPTWAKAMVYGALGYFINTFDAIPDITPGMGFVDDLGVLIAALGGVAAYVKPDIKQRAENKVKTWFGAEEPTGDVINTQARNRRFDDR